MAKPLFSIIIPTLNEELFLPKLLDSLVAQTFKNFEVFVVDGGSDDKTSHVASKYTDRLPSLTVITNAKRNVSYQRNTGAHAASGEWVIFIDADSILLPYALERSHKYILAHDPTIFTSWFGPDTDKVGEVIVTLGINMIYESGIMLKKPFTMGTFAGVKRQTFLLVGGYDETISYGEDFDMTKRVCQQGGRYSLIRETLYIYSLRRFRYQKTLTSIQVGFVTIMSVLFLNRTPKSIAGYIMGGHPYASKKKRIKRSAVAQYQRKIRQTLKELFRNQ